MRRPLRIQPLRIRRLPAVLTVHPLPHASGQRNPLHVHGAEIARMDDRRAELAQQAPHAAVGGEVLARPLVERNHLDIGATDALAELLAESRQADDRVPVAFGRQAVDEIDEPVLQPAEVEPMDDVRDQRRAGMRHAPQASTAKPLTAHAPWLATKLREPLLGRVVHGRRERHDALGDRAARQERRGFERLGRELAHHRLLADHVPVPDQPLAAAVVDHQLANHVALAARKPDRMTRIVGEALVFELGE